MHYLLDTDGERIRPLTFDEAEMLGLDGTLRGSPPRQFYPPREAYIAALVGIVATAMRAEPERYAGCEQWFDLDDIAHVDSTSFVTDTDALFGIHVNGEEYIEFCNACTEEAERRLFPRQRIVFEAEIPGKVFASYEDGEITNLAFTPFGGSAGHFGPSAIVTDGDSGDIDLEDVDGPFWRAMQSHLATHKVSWVE